MEKKGLEKLTSQNIQSLFSTLQKENPEVIDLYKKDSILHKKIAVDILNAIKVRVLLIQREYSHFIFRNRHISFVLNIFQAMLAEV